MKSSVDAAPMTLAATHDGRRKKRLDYRRLLFQIVFLLPAVGFLVVFMFYPIEETFRTSMMQTSALSPPTFIGFENYQRLFASASSQGPMYWRAFYSVVIQIPLSSHSRCRLRSRHKQASVIYYMASIMPLRLWQCSDGSSLL